MTDVVDKQAELGTEPHPAVSDHEPVIVHDNEAEGPGRDWAALIGGFIMVGLLVALVFASAETGQLGRLVRIAVTIVIVVAGSWALFVASNALVSQATSSWTRYRTLIGGLLGAIGFGLLRGNRSVGALVADSDFLLLNDGDPFVVEDQNLIDILSGVGDVELVEYANGFLGLIEWPIVGAVLGLIAGFASGAPAPRAVRMAVPAAVGAAAGWLIASNLLFANRPDASITGILVWTAIGAAAGGAFALLRRVTAPKIEPHIVSRVLMGAAVGATIGAWFVPDLGTGSIGAARLASIVPLVLLGVRFGWPKDRTVREIVDFNRRGRAFVFLAPALVFLAANLVIPAIRTIYTSLLDRESEEFVGLDNYETLFAADDFIDTSNWTNMFTSQLFLVGIVALISGTLIGTFIHRSRNGTVGLERTGGSVGPILIGVFLLLVAAFSVIRGTFANTLWWMLMVTVMSTVLGLTIAVLAERAGRFESAAKALVFMPMAISFVGASIIWRFQYQRRNAEKDQTSVLNALWVELGKLSHSGWPRILALIVLAALAAITIYRIIGRVQNGQAFAGYSAALIVLGYLFIELVRRSLGGFEILDDGTVISEGVAFREEVRPFNNVYLMFIMIWIQTGFAMVILSAAIKAVPGELLEASEIDGATDSQQFFHVILPQIMPTLGVVLTATMVAVVKVFDIVKVSTGGNFGTNVLANDFFTVAFQFFDRGRGSAIAVMILLTVAPILIMNVRQMQRETA